MIKILFIPMFNLFVKLGVDPQPIVVSGPTSGVCGPGSAQRSCNK